MSRLRFAGVALFSLTAACFGEAPDGSGGSDGESGSSGSQSPTTGESESSTVADTSSTSIDPSTTDPSTSESSDSSGDPDTGSESTGEPVVCMCPDDAIECESFENGFDVEELPWAVPGGVAPTVVDDPVKCGEAALRTAVEPGDPYSAASHSLPDELLAPGVHNIHAWVQLSGKCTDLPTRLLQVQRSGPPPTSVFSYGIDLFADGGNVELRLQGPVGVYDPTTAPFALAQDTWYEIEIAFDLLAEPPVVTVTIDGDVVLDGIEGPAASPLPNDPRLATVLGVYQIAAFEQPCAAVYDDFSAG